MSKNILRAVILILGFTAIFMMCRDLIYRYGMRNTPYYRYTIKVYYKDANPKIVYVNAEDFIVNDSLVILDKQEINRE